MLIILTTDTLRRYEPNKVYSSDDLPPGEAAGLVKHGWAVEVFVGSEGGAAPAVEVVDISPAAPTEPTEPTDETPVLHEAPVDELAVYDAGAEPVEEAPVEAGDPDQPTKKKRR